MTFWQEMRKMKKSNQAVSKTIFQCNDIYDDVHFVVEQDIDEGTYLYFTIAPTNKRKQKKSTDIVINTSKSEGVNILSRYLKYWDFEGDKAISMYLGCDCGCDLMRFTKIREECFNDSCDSVRVHYMTNFALDSRRFSEVQISREDAVHLADILADY